MHLYLLSGLAWGALAWVFGAKALGPSIWAGIFSSPVIGLIIGLTLQRRFEAASVVRRWLFALLGLYVGATLFGVVIGVAEWWPVSDSQGVAENLVEGVGATVIGMTITGFFVLFWPLSYLTHRTLAAARGVTLPK